jgi:hypothetical protein
VPAVGLLAIIVAVLIAAGMLGLVYLINQWSTKKRD